MRRPAPVLFLLRETQRTCRTLRRELSEQRIRNLSLETRLAVALRERDQARRDSELLALCARDRKTALSILRTQHHIDQLPEGLAVIEPKEAG